MGRSAVAAAMMMLALPGLPASGPAEATAVFAGGCFWGVESVFEHVRGVRSVVAGYSGGSVARPRYAQVNTGSTGHAESVRIVYDPEQVSYRQLLEVFFLVAHDPTTRDRQGPDAGSDYRAIVFTGDSAERRMAEGYIAELAASHVFQAPIVTEIRPRAVFWPAEDYHQHYAERHPSDPYIVINDAPKVRRLQVLFPRIYRDATTP